MVATAQALGASSTAFPGALAGARWEAEQPGLEVVLTWHAGNALHTMQILVHVFFNGKIMLSPKIGIPEIFVSFILSHLPKNI